MLRVIWAEALFEKLLLHCRTPVELRCFINADTQTMDDKESLS
jgi:hypothetical protein